MRFLLFLIIPFLGKSQINWKEKVLPEYENVYVEKISEDSLQSSFFIAVKKNVLEHFHKEHTETIIVLSGRAVMLMGSQEIKLVPGVQVTIPKNTIHSVQVRGRKSLKVISVQSPRFDGTDRHFPKIN